MEYPQLITSLLSPLPDGVRIIESVDAHEFGHQWVPMMIDTDEVEEALARRRSESELHRTGDGSAVP